MLRTLNAFLILILLSCKNDPAFQKDAVVVPVTDTIQYEPLSTDGAVAYVVTGGSVQWAGKKAMGDSHEGVIAVNEGELLVNKDRLLSGTILIDMHTLAVTNMKDGGERRDLESHLKDVDFFEVNEYPKAEFSFKEVLPSNTKDFNQVIVGELKMKGKTHSVNVPVALRFSGDELTAKSPNFPINRTKWGINFRSGMLGTVKDKLIEDTVLISIKLTAKRK